ncbi:MAG: hypothetical protein JNM83_14345 [Myxococcales bacterium]|jgi:hypothetical protein|nr:hypothetical protein [Myxococcales bacterium]
MDKTSLWSFAVPVLASHPRSGTLAIALGIALAAPPTVALAAPPAPAPRPVVGKPAASKPVGTKPQDTARKPEPPKSGCSPLESGFVMTPVDVALKCDESWEKCESDIPLRAKNCTGEFQSIYRLEMYESGRRSLELEFDPAPIVPNGGSWKEAIPWTTPGDLEAVVFFRAPGSTSEQSVRGTVKIANKGLAAAKAACEKCSGVWGRYGVNRQQGCNCKTTDAGKVCIDGDDCEGLCLFRRYDDQAREEGVCSEQQRMTGCISIVMKGQSQLKPRIPPPKKLPTCLD